LPYRREVIPWRGGKKKGFAASKPEAGRGETSPIPAGSCLLLTLMGGEKGGRDHILTHIEKKWENRNRKRGEAALRGRT